MMMSQVLISSTPSSIPSSKFARKERLVYIVPSVDDCMGLLPRHIGNYILSYTCAFMTFYIENLVIKYGERFVTEIFNNDIFRRVTFQNLHKQTLPEKIQRFIKYAISSNTQRDQIISVFQTKIQERTLLIQSQQQQKMAQKEELLALVSLVNVGDIISANNKFYLIVEKSKLCYYSVEIRFDPDTNQGEYNHISLRDYYVDIDRNERFRNMIILPKKKLVIITHNLTVVRNPDITNKHKRAYVLELFGYRKRSSNSEFVRN